MNWAVVVGNRSYLEAMPSAPAAPHHRSIW